MEQNDLLAILAEPDFIDTLVFEVAVCGQLIDVMASRLVPAGSVGFDSDAAMSVSTYPTDFIPKLLNRSAAACSKYQVRGVGGDGKGYEVVGVGPAAYRTRATQTGKPCWLVVPRALLLRKPSERAADLRVVSYPQMRAHGIGFASHYNGGDDDVVFDKNTGVTIKAEIRGILVIPIETKRNATALGSVGNIELLIDDIGANRVSAIVSGSLMHYQGVSVLTTSCRKRKFQLATDCAAASADGRSYLRRSSSAFNASE